MHANCALHEGRLTRACELTAARSNWSPHYIEVFKHIFSHVAAALLSATPRSGLRMLNLNFFRNNTVQTRRG